MVKFFLLGAFEVELDTADRKPLGDTMAAKILAFLAYQNRFCSRDEIVQACWGTQKAKGRDKLEDEAYQRQVSNVRALLNGFGLSWQEYLLTQPNGMQLKDGTFTTDVITFGDLVSVGQDKDLPVQERLAALQEAESLRRGYLLDGMNCEWVVSHEGGARRDWSDRHQSIRRILEQLRSEGDASGSLASNQVAYYVGFDDLISAVRKAVTNAKDEIIFYGINFHNSIPAIRDLLFERLEAGVKMKFLLLDPKGEWIHHMARSTSNQVLTLQSEGVASLSGLLDIGRRWEAKTDTETVAANFEVRLYDSMVHGRVYAVDPDDDRGKLIFFPYLHGISPSLLPGYLWPYGQEGPFRTYVKEVRRLWEDPMNRPILQLSDIGG